MKISHKQRIALVKKNILLFSIFVPAIQACYLKNPFHEEIGKNYVLRGKEQYFLIKNKETNHCLLTDKESEDQLLLLLHDAKVLKGPLSIRVVNWVYEYGFDHDKKYYEVVVEETGDICSLEIAQFAELQGLP